MEKKIHYCWFGGKKLPKSVKKCISTWKKMLPDYEIKEWNESNFDINACQFVKEAYENKKWAFVSDYVRIYALYQEGGIYFDTDMKIVKDISNIIDKEMFLGYEDSGYIGTAVIGVKEKNNPYIKEVLEYYNKIEHFNVDIMYNYANPVILTKIVKKYDYNVDEQGIQIFNNDIYVYPRDYFYPLSYNYSEKVYTENTCMIHLFNATWTDKGEKRTIGIYRKFGPTLGKTLNKMIDKLGNVKGNVFNFLKKIYNFARMKYSIYINRGKRIRKIEEQLANMKEQYVTICHPEMVEENDGIHLLFKDNVLEIREQYTKKEAHKIAKVIIDSGKKLVIFNSYAEGWDKIISELKLLKRNIIIKILIYGENFLLAEEEKWNTFNTILNLYNKGQIDELGFFKKSLYDFHREKGYRTSLLMKYVEIEDKEKYILKKEKSEVLEVGLYKVYDNMYQNLYNQLNAISLIDNARLDCAPMNYKISMIARLYNINLSGKGNELTKESLYSRMANNDINLYITLIDDSKSLPLESLELGTICMIGENCRYFEGSELEKYLIINKNDNIMEIYHKIKEALNNKEKILTLYNEWKIEYLKNAKESIRNFLKME